MRVLVVALVAAGAALAACPPAKAPGAECAVNADCKDQGVCNAGKCEPCDFGLPPPSDACIPKCGNELGVGQPCTKKGGECSGFDIALGQAVFCTSDFNPTNLSYCTKPCSKDADCGTGGACAGDDQSGHGCIPASCNGEGEGEGAGEGEGEGEGSAGEGEGEGGQ
jgi:hypothetical protein